MAPANAFNIQSSIVDPPGLLQKDLSDIPRRRRLLSGFQRSCRRLVRYWWAWEFLAAGLSIISTAALIVVLKESDQKKQQPIRIGKAELTLNAIVAAISTVIRTSLTVTVAGALNQSAWNWFATLKSGVYVSPGKPINDLDIFGDASSNSWSSLRLLWRTRGCALASLGALLIVLSLAFDTFSQQVLGLEIRSVRNLNPDPNTSLPRMSSFTDVFDSNATEIDMLYRLQGIIAANIFNRDVSIPASPCSSGNCSWPVTPSIGVCSSCIDAQGSISKSLYTTENKTGELTSDGPPINSSVDWLQYSLSWENSQFRPFSSDVANEGAFSSVNSLNLSLIHASMGLPWKYTIANVSLIRPGLASGLTTEGKLPIVQFFALGIPPANVESFKASYNLTMLRQYGEVGNNTLITLSLDDVEPLLTAYNCTFSFCLQGYQAETKDGIAQERLLESWDFTTLFAKSGDWSVDGKPVGGNNVWKFTNVPQSLNAGNESSYVIDGDSIAYLANSILPSLVGSAEVDLLSDGRGTGGLRFFDDFNPNYATSGAIMEAFWKASASLSDMNDLCQHIANGVTTWMRTSWPAKADPRYASTIIANETLVRVRWPWLFYPVALLMLGHVFLLATIWHTQRLRVHPWKGHRIPLLLANIDNGAKEVAAGGLQSRTGLDERIGRAKMLLEYDNNDTIAFEKA